MERETNPKKKKVKIKANTEINKVFLLKKEYLHKEQDTLILKKIVKKENLPTKNKKNNQQQISVAKTNIIKLNDQNTKLNEKILTISKISKALGGKPILKNISLTLNRGQILGLLGPNGAGKSTLFNLIVGKIFPDLGEIN